MSGPHPRVAILGGGMAGVATAWRLSEPGWQERLGSITLYQRGHRLGGKGASSRGAHGRVEEHGLHVWLGYYDNAFRLLRECYAELDRTTTDPDCPIQTWQDALAPSADLGLEDRHRGEWRHWVGTFATNDQLPGEPFDDKGTPGLADLTRQGLALVLDFLDSMPTLWDAPSGVRLSASPRPPSTMDPVVHAFRVALVAGLLDAMVQLERLGDNDRAAVASLDRVLDLLRTNLEPLIEDDADVRRMWMAISMMTATARGVVADGLATTPDGIERANEEDFLDWVIRHGADPRIADFAFIRGLYELVFAPVDGDRSVRGVAAGVAVTVTLRLFFQYHGSIFWKMQAGMGDVVFAPLHEALVARGVAIEYFHRLDHLHVADDGFTIEAISMGRQAELAPGRTRYDPLVRVKGLPCFPDRPIADQLADPRAAEQDLESHFCEWPDAASRRLRRGSDFDVAVLAVPIDMARIVADELVQAAPAWRQMVERVETTATIALQLWLRPDEPALGWTLPGVTVSGYASPFATWASMPQLLPVEDWPERDRPGTIAYFCGASDAPWPPDLPAAAYRQEHEARTSTTARTFVEDHLPHLLPGTGPAGAAFRWDLLCSGDGPIDGPGALDHQFTSTNIDPSNRYVLCVPGSDRFRLRSDESGYDNLFLAGDWTDNGLNAGCIEAAVLSGLQAANAVLGRARFHRISGGYGR